LGTHNNSIYDIVNIKPVAGCSVTAHDLHRYPGDHERNQEQNRIDDYGANCHVWRTLHY
jgi:hypothetical protein